MHLTQPAPDDSAALNLSPPLQPPAPYVLDRRRYCAPSTPTAVAISARAATSVTATMMAIGDGRGVNMPPTSAGLPQTPLHARCPLPARRLTREMSLHRQHGGRQLCGCDGRGGGGGGSGGGGGGDDSIRLP